MIYKGRIQPVQKLIKFRPQMGVHINLREQMYLLSQVIITSEVQGYR